MLQTDGWLSKESASIYELSTETLFLGRQDAMQRQTLVPLMQHMRGSTPASTPPRILEIACGTGRFATFMKVCACEPVCFSAYMCEAVDLLHPTMCSGHAAGVDGCMPMCCA